MGHQPRICPTYVSTIEILFGYTIKLLNDVAANQIDSRKFDIKFDKTPPTRGNCGLCCTCMDSLVFLSENLH